MGEAARRLTFGGRPAAAINEARRELMEELSKTRVSINQAYTAFNNATDPDLITSCVFEINSLEARYSYLLRQAKEREKEKLEGGSEPCLR